MASVPLNLDVEPPEILPAETYGAQGPVKLRIATGGIGTTGLLKALADAFIADCLQNSPEFRANPWRIAWLLTDTSLSYNALATRSADVAVTFHPYADLITLAQGVAERREYIFRDAFCLVAIQSLSTPGSPIRFLSRYDKSANNILESRIWTTIGQTPWSDPQSNFYHRFNSFPLPSLEAANKLGEYSLVDRGTWYSCNASIKDSLICFKEGAIEGHDVAGDTFEEGRPYALNTDSLSNPAHALLGMHAKFKQEGTLFMNWLVREDGGRKVISELQWSGVQAYGLPPRAS